MSNNRNSYPPTLYALFSYLIDNVDRSALILPTEIPNEIMDRFTHAENIIAEIKVIVGDKGHGDYFGSSIERYKHYLAIADAILPKGASILDVGNAPGHVGIGLHLLGMKVKGINLNDEHLGTYPSAKWPELFNALSLDIENNLLPFDDNSFDAVYFTEVLEHIAIKNPDTILSEFWRVIKPGGLFVLSTPNMCNISNIFALMNGKNIFWPSNLFYGSTDRHNREYTPKEVMDLVKETGFNDFTIYGFNCSSNWRGGGNEFAEKAISKFNDHHPLLRNTIMVYAIK